MQQSQTAEVLSLLNSTSATPRTSMTWEHDHMTALLLRSGESAVAALPLSRRTIAVAPGRQLQVGWISSNQFTARMGVRRQTRGTAAAWPELLPELDAMLVVLRDQPSLTARWYAQTGFAPVAAIRCLYLDMTEPPAGPAGRYAMRVASVEDIAAWGPQMRAVHEEVFGNYGGPLVRNEDFWHAALPHHFYREHYQFQVIGLWSGASGGAGSGAGLAASKEGDHLMGYAVVGWSGWHSKRPRMDILELATRQWDTGVAQELIRTTCQLAWSKNVQEVRAVISVHDPYRGYLMRTGFEDRWGYALQMKWLHPQRYLDRVPPVEGLGDLAVQLDSPGQVSLRLGGGGAAPRLVHVQADLGSLTRLLCQRLEIAAAVHDGTLLVREGSEADVSRLALALPWTPWVFHMLDYI